MNNDEIVLIHIPQDSEFIEILGHRITWTDGWEEFLEYLKRCALAIDKVTPKKPDYEGDGYADGYMVYDTWFCPCCGKHYEVDYDDYDYCPNCGQAIDWEVEEPSNE